MIFIILGIWYWKFAFCPYDEVKLFGNNRIWNLTIKEMEREFLEFDKRESLESLLS